jgi:hypothetical protein
MTTRSRTTTDAAAPRQNSLPDRLPTARPTSHLPNFMLWLGLLLLGIAGFFSQQLYVRHHAHAPPPPGREREAFVALSFGKIGDNVDDAMTSAAFLETLQVLRSAGFLTVSLAQVDALLRSGAALPDHPLLLLFEEAQRDTMDAADAALAKVGFRAAAFADVRQLEAGNVDLVSRHRLGQLVDGDRWEFAIAGCPPKPADEASESFVSSDELRHGREQLARWTGKSPLAAECRRPLSGAATNAWNTALKEASLPLGFVLGNPRADYRDDPPFALRSVRVAKEWRANDVLERVAAHAPRREPFRDEFSGVQPSRAWVVDRGEVTQQHGSLRLAARAGDNGALASLGGTERWRDAEVTVEVDQLVRGQFWLTLRSQPGTALRLGLADGFVVLQESDDKETHQLARRQAGSRHVKLGLRVIGTRAIATVDGVAMLDRPAAVPIGIDRGPLALAVWEPQGGAEVRLARIEARPLARQYGIVGARPSADAWEELRHRVDELAALSPRWFAWRGDRAVETTERDDAMVIFAGLHRLALLPAVQLDLDHTAAAQRAGLAKQLFRWATEPGSIEGLNLIVDRRIAVDPDWTAFFADLRAKLAPHQARLALTIIDGSPQDDPVELFHLPPDDVSALQIAEGRILDIGSALPGAQDGG